MAKGIGGLITCRWGTTVRRPLLRTIIVCMTLTAVPHRSVARRCHCNIDKVISSAGGLRELIDTHDIHNTAAAGNLAIYDKYWNGIWSTNTINAWESELGF